MAKKQNMVWIPDLKIKELRRDFSRLVLRCACVEGAMKGECDPKSCYPELYAFLYPKGGFSVISRTAAMRRKARAAMNRKYGKRKGVRHGGKKEGSTAPQGLA